MDYFPIFLDLRGRRCLVVGEGEAAAAKVEMLRRAGAAAVIATDFAPALLEGVHLVTVAGATRAIGEAVSRAAQARRIPVNVMDEPDLCSFFMPAIVDRAPVIVAIGTGGAAPLLARRLREWLDRMLPPRLGDLAALAGRFRAPVRRRLSDPLARRHFWERVFAGEVTTHALGGAPDAAAALGRALDAEAAEAERAA
jgi:uroporphyrin-III C-methyltransferase / precorrin-2 dehydrogenase / sirohydrochlorin ferrochelatase